jgi:hemerythrin
MDNLLEPARLGLRAIHVEATMTIRWTKALSVGIASIDEQHKELFRRAKAFLEGVEGRSRQDVGILLSYLRTYAVTHFGEEEEAMRASDFPGYERHKAQHDRFLKDLMILSREQDKRGGKGVPAADLGTLLRKWMHQHVTVTDAEMARYLVSRGFEDLPAPSDVP